MCSRTLFLQICASDAGRRTQGAPLTDCGTLVQLQTRAPFPNRRSTMSNIIIGLSCIGIAIKAGSSGRAGYAFLFLTVAALNFAAAIL